MAASAGRLGLYGFAAVGVSQTAYQLFKSLQTRSAGIDQRRIKAGAPPAPSIAPTTCVYCPLPPWGEYPWACRRSKVGRRTLRALLKLSSSASQTKRRTVALLLQRRMDKR